jgi:mgtE-like transporter
LLSNSIRQLGLIKTTKQSLLSLIFDLGSVFAGLIVAISLNIFSYEVWIVALYPGILSMRGVVGGIFSARLSTGLHLGTIKLKLVGDESRGLYSLWASIAVLTLESCIFLSCVMLLFGGLFWGVSAFKGLVILCAIFATMGLSILVISPITVFIAFSSFKKGLDPDIIIYPIVSTIADILVTVCYILVLKGLFFSGSLGLQIVLFTCLGFVSFALAILYKRRAENAFVKILKESAYTMVIVAFIVSITGSILSKISGVAGHRSEIFVVYPALINTMGDVGAIVGSTATTKLALGSFVASFSSLKNHKNQALGVCVASMIVYVILATLTSIYQNLGFFMALRLIGLLLATNICAASVIVCIAFSVAILTFHRGLDPDNFVIPIESSLADTITTLSLFAMLGLVGYV